MVISSGYRVDYLGDLSAEVNRLDGASVLLI
jgi:hypothetical protein